MLFKSPMVPKVVSLRKEENAWGCNNLRWLLIHISKMMMNWVQGMVGMMTIMHGGLMKLVDNMREVIDLMAIRVSRDPWLRSHLLIIVTIIIIDIHGIGGGGG